MKRQRFTAEQIVNKLRQAEVLLAQHQTIPQVSKVLGITEQTYYGWRKEHGGVRTDQARRFKDLERENARPKRNWTRRFCGRRPTQTSEPAAETLDGRSRGRVSEGEPAAGVSGVGSVADDAAVSVAGPGRRRATHETSDRIGGPLWPVRNAADHRDSKMVLHYYHLHDAESKRQMARVNFGLSAGALPTENDSISNPASKEGTEKDVSDRG